MLASRRADPARRILTAAVTAWLAGVTAERLDDLAIRGTDMTEELRAFANPAWRAVARAWVGPDEERALRNLTDADLDAVLDDILQRYPDKGLVLWRHRFWYRDQMRRIVAAFLEW